MRRIVTRLGARSVALVAEATCRVALGVALGARDAQRARGLGRRDVGRVGARGRARRRARAGAARGRSRALRLALALERGASVTLSRDVDRGYYGLCHLYLGTIYLERVVPVTLCCEAARSLGATASLLPTSSAARNESRSAESSSIWARHMAVTLSCEEQDSLSAMPSIDRPSGRGVRRWRIVAQRGEFYSFIHC